MQMAFIEILQSGPLFWIRANEFDDIRYFPSEAEATAYAGMQYEGPISALEERQMEDGDDEE